MNLGLKSYGDRLLFARLLTDQASLVPLTGSMLVTESAALSLSLTVTAVVVVTGMEDWLRLDRAVAVCTGLLVGSYLLELAVLVNNVAETRFTVMAAVLAAGLATRPTDMAGMLVTDLETRPTDLVATKQLTDSAVTRLGCKGLVRLVIDLVAVSFTSAMEAKQCRLVVSYGIRKLDETSTSSYNGLLSVALDPSAYKMAPNMWNHDSGRTTILRQPRVPLS
ncbi:hypothetical protein PI126_g20375 [Phytophthora idaei]|nr:hypothetical protein PI126_g20375 [Phytophthora idaei]